MCPQYIQYLWADREQGLSEGNIRELGKNQERACPERDQGRGGADQWPLQRGRGDRRTGRGRQHGEDLLQRPAGQGLH